MPARYQTDPRSDAERRQREGFQLWLSVYEAWAQSWWEAAEHETMLYETELAEYKQRVPMPQLKQYMLQTRGQAR